MSIITTENGLEYDGPFSYTGEWHIAMLGFPLGIVLGWNKSVRKEFLKEPYYFIGSVFLGVVVGYYTKEKEK